jgi:cellulose biosynthesis protein BcsQ
MWSAEITILENNLTKYKIYQNTKRMCFQDVIELLKNNTEFIRFFNELLSTSPYEAYFWEVKPTTLNRQQDDFEFVLIDSPALLRIHADNKTFSKYFDGNKNAIFF